MISIIINIIYHPLTKTHSCVARCNCALDDTYLRYSEAHRCFFKEKKNNSKCIKEIEATTLNEVFDYGLSTDFDVLSRK